MHISTRYTGVCEWVRWVLCALSVTAVLDINISALGCGVMMATNAQYHTHVVVPPMRRSLVFWSSGPRRCSSCAMWRLGCKSRDDVRTIIASTAAIAACVNQMVLCGVSL